MEHEISRQLPVSKESVALAYVQQARDFYEAAQNPRLGSKPLLYYYAFLNLAKATLVTRGVPIPPAARHGISDPRANVRQRLRLSGQRVLIEACAADHRQIFPEFVRLLGGDGSTKRSISVVDLLRQVPVIHRTFTQVSGATSSLLPLKSITVLGGDGAVWARLTLDRLDRDVKLVLPAVRHRRSFRSVFHQVASASADELWFETAREAAHARSFDPAIATLAKQVRAIGASSILTRFGYRHYLTSLAPRFQLPDLAAALAVAFYFGSVVRYKPDVFAKVAAGGFSWVVREFFASAPNQFLYGLSSFLAGVDVIRPFGSLD